jgi:hypothetical protein
MTCGNGRDKPAPGHELAPGEPASGLRIPGHEPAPPRRDSWLAHRDWDKSASDRGARGRASESRDGRDGEWGAGLFLGFYPC